MAKSGLYTGVDIGTSTIKVLVAEYIAGEMNIIGVGNAKSDGLRNGIISDIELVAVSIQKAVNAAEERAGIKIERVNVGLPANMLEVETCQGVVPVGNESREITNKNVVDVVSNALLRSVIPEREIIAVEPKEFVVDGFPVSDPRGMFGVRLEMRGMMYTGPKTLVHNLRTAVERAGLLVDNIAILPLAVSHHVLSEGEREFGTTVIDMGAGQTSVAVIKDQELQTAITKPEGGDYVTKDISTVLNTSIAISEDLKLNYGEASTERASQDEHFPVEVVGKVDPIQITEYHLSEIIEARLTQIFTKLRNELDHIGALKLPGGVILIGGAAAMPGVAELATKVLGANVKLYIPSEMGLRNPAFAQVISIVDYIGSRKDIEVLVQKTVVADSPQADVQGFEQAPVVAQEETYAPEYDYEPVAESEPEYVAPRQESATTNTTPEEDKPGIVDRVKGIFESFFD